MKFAAPFAFPFGGPFIAAFSNLGFEIQGTNIGDAASWTRTVVSSVEMIALFGPVAATAHEAELFESGWDANEDYLFVFDPFSDIVAPLFDTALSEGQTFEDFEQGWDSNESYAFTMSSALEAQFNTTNDLYDGFEVEWDANEDYDFVMGSTTAAAFDAAPENVEDFEEGWSDNGNYDFTMGATTLAAFDGASPENVEDFEETFGPIVGIADYANSKLLKASHGLTNTTPVYLESATGVLLPNGLLTNTKYFVVGATTNDFQLATVSGGAAIVFTAFGDGAVAVRKDPTRFWGVVASLP